jgi:hypothetical protein
MVVDKDTNTTRRPITKDFGPTTNTALNFA